MADRPFSATGLRMLNSLPPVLRGSYDYQAIVHALAREVDLADVALGVVGSQLNPQTADVLLDAWEYTVRLPVGGAGATTAQRRSKIVGRLQKLLGASEGREWEAQVSEVLGDDWSYEEHVPGDALSPPVDTIRITLPFAAAGALYQNALNEIRELTPAHLAIELVGGTGFLLDESQLDVVGLHV